jgi:hypothetical protein
MINDLWYKNWRDDADAALAAALREFDEVAERAIARIDAVIIGDVRAIVLAGRWLKWHQPQRGDAEALQIVEAPQQPLEIGGPEFRLAGRDRRVDDEP